MNERQSNIELLRLLCMFLIIWGHFIYYGILHGSEIYANQTGFGMMLPRIIRGFSWCAVDAFILISGYFSIRPKAKSFINLYLVCAFYAGIFYIIHLYHIGSHLNRWVLFNTLMPFGLWEINTKWWFIPNYLMLYILSPLLNRVTDNLPRERFRIVLFLASIPILYFGWYRNMSWNEYGFNFINFCYLYLIGRYISQCHITKGNVTRITLWLIGWLVSGGIIGLSDVLREQCSISNLWISQMMWYNSPMCLFSAICLFMTFRETNISNNQVVNWYAASAFSIYLVHDNVYFRKLIANFVSSQYTPPFVRSYGIMLILSLGIVLFVPLIDKLRIMITNPICNYLCKAYYKTKPYLIRIVEG